MTKQLIIIISLLLCINSFAQVDAIKIVTAKKAYENKDYQIALDELNEVTSAGRKTKIFLYYKAYVHYNMKQYDSAEIYLKKYLLLDIDNTDVANAIADIEYMRKKEIELTSHITNQIKIGSQEWELGNLNTSTFRNGDPIPEAETEAQWKKANDERKPAWCYYNGDASNGKTYGKLYNWYAVVDERGLAPEGWHIPDEDEWSTLINYLGGENYASGKMKTTFGWDLNKYADNSSGFSAYPGGYRSHNGIFLSIGEWGHFWSTTYNDNNNIWEYGLMDEDIIIYRRDHSKGSGLSVRCIRD